MTIKEAINWYETKLAVNEMINLKGPQNDAARLALDALRAQQEQPNEPLTLEELREMDGEPVWADIPFWGEPQWVLIRIGKNGMRVTNSIGGGFLLSDTDFKISKFYRRK